MESYGEIGRVPVNLYKIIRQNYLILLQKYEIFKVTVAISGDNQ